MRIDREHIFLSIASTEQAEVLLSTVDEIKSAVLKVVWPLKNDKFSIRAVRMGNGVKPIKNEFVNDLKKLGWKTETSIKIVEKLGAGPIDAIKETKFGIFAVEWETGNISSSHRAINKMALSLIQGKIIGGFLIIPIRKLARYLTDRIGNYEEIEPYFELWQNVQIKQGILGVIGVDYDELCETVEIIPKGKDGNAVKKPPM